MVSFLTFPEVKDHLLGFVVALAPYFQGTNLLLVDGLIILRVNHRLVGSSANVRMELELLDPLDLYERLGEMVKGRTAFKTKLSF